MFIENADPTIKEYSEINPDFKNYYETNADFRELCDLIAKAPIEKVRQAREIFEKSLKEC